MGMAMAVPSVARAVVPACADDADCHYAVDISIPTDDLADTIARLEEDGDLMWVDIDLTLVRTFGGGTWLQVLALHLAPSVDGSMGVSRIGALEPAHGDLSRTGLFPASQAKSVVAGEAYNEDPLDYASIVENLRRKAGDDSASMPTVYTDLHVAFVRGCLGWSYLALHDFDGNLLFYEESLMGKALINGATTMPIDRPWFVTVDAGEGIRRPMMQLGPIEAGGSGEQAVIWATMDCATRTGTLSLTGDVVGPSPSPAPSKATPSPSLGAATPMVGPSLSPDPETGGAQIDANERPDWLLLLAVLLGALVLAAGLRRRAARS